MSYNDNMLSMNIVQVSLAKGELEKYKDLDINNNSDNLLWICAKCVSSFYMTILKRRSTRGWCSSCEEDFTRSNGLPHRPFMDDKIPSNHLLYFVLNAGK